MVAFAAVVRMLPYLTRATVSDAATIAIQVFDDLTSHPD